MTQSEDTQNYMYLWAYTNYTKLFILYHISENQIFVSNNLVKKQCG